MKLTAEQRAWLVRTQAEWLNLFKPASTHLGRHIFDVGPKVPDAAVRNARVFGSRVSSLEALPRGGVVAEVGTQTGRFAEEILAALEPEALHLFDLEFDTLHRERPNLAGNPKVSLHLGDSSVELARFSDAMFDWIYIDGDHMLDGVKRDTAVATRVLKPDGILVFNDYTVWSAMEMADYGVVPVVNEMLASGEWVLIYLALHPMMYCDVGLRKV